MDNDLRERLRISEQRLGEVNDFLLAADNRVVDAFLDVVARYGTPEEINRQAEEARRLPTLLAQLRSMDSPYVRDLEWLTEQRDRREFISQPAYRRKILGGRVMWNLMNASP